MSLDNIFNNSNILALMLNFIKNIFGGKNSESPKPAPVVSQPVAPPPVNVSVTPPIKTLPFLTPEKLKTILHNNSDYQEWYKLLIEFLPQYEINTIERVSEFLANSAHESGDFKILQENLNYSKDRLLIVFPKYFNASNVEKYANKPIAIASKIYANRMGNGTEESTEGWRFRGRGLIQLTGKLAYVALSKYIGKTIDEICDYLTTKEGALLGSLFYWKTNNINKIADTKDVAKVRKAVNGGLIGLSDVTARYNTIKKILMS